jgi:hypothetical protein
LLSWQLEVTPTESKSVYTDLLNPRRWVSIL